MSQNTQKFKTTDIKGKPYVNVNERVKYFRTHQSFNGWAIITEIIELTADTVTIKCFVSDETGRIISTGIANENKADGYINRTSYIENCETSAVGRALGFLGIGIDESIGSFEEVFTAISKEDQIKKTRWWNDHKRFNGY